MSLPAPPRSEPADPLFTGGGEMGRRMQAFDWSRHPLGPPAQWPQSLRTTIRIMLTSRYAMWLGWGREFWFFCNDAYLPTVGIKESWVLGASARKVWAEIWADIGPRAESVVTTGQATWDEGLRLFLERSGAPEETYHTFSYSPLPDDHGGTGGMLCVVTEETERRIAERRIAFLRDLAAELARTNNEPEVLAGIERQLAAHPHDLPFALLYLFQEDGAKAKLAAAAGIAPGHPLAPRELSVRDPQAPWPVAEISVQAEPLLVRELAARSAAPLPGGPWDQPPREAKLVPLTQQGQAGAAGFLVAALNPYRPVDEAYRGFIRLLAGQLGSALANARAYAAEKRRAEALAALDRAKTEFFSNVSHEFRTPLTLMLAPLEDELSRRTENRERLETAHRNSLRLLKLVNSLLDFSRIEAGRIRASYVPTDLGRFTAELASAFESVVDKAGLRLVIDCPPLPAPVHVDREMWEKIVFNLVSNAFKFTFEGEIAVSVRLRGEFAELTVRDTGTGIPAAEQARIFERFHRIAGARSRSHEGTGIGLALVSELARLHGGAVGVESEEGRGTTFRVTVRTGTAHLPPGQLGAATGLAPTGIGAAAFVEEASRWLPSEEVAESAPPPEPGARRSRIVLADDNRDMRDYLVRLLAPHHDVIAVGDGEAAFTAVLEQKPDLVLTDVMMPRLDGYGLLRRLRQTPKTSGVPVIVLSARAGEESRIEGLERGADDYLVKPFSARELLARVNTHLELARIRREAAERVRETEERFRHVADHSPTIFWVTEPDGHCSYLNERWYEYTGQTREEALGSGWLRAVHPEDAPATAQVFQRATRERSAFRAEYRVRRHDGAYRWMIVTGAPRFLHGQFAGFVGSLLDITEKREELEAVEQSRSQMQLALQAGRSGTFEWDMPTGRVTWSPELEQLYGLPPGAFGRSYRAWAAHVVPEDVAAVEAILRRCFEQRSEHADYEFRAILPDGTQRWLVAKARFLYAANGAPRKMIGINVDIDERKRAERNAEFVSRLNQDLTLLADPEEIIRTASDRVGEFLGADRCHFATLDETATTAAIGYNWRRDPAARDLAGHYKLEDYGAREGWETHASHRIKIDDVTRDPLTRATAANYQPLGIAAWMKASFTRDGRWVATLTVASERPRHWRDDEAQLLENVLSRVWPLVERARAEQAMAKAEEKIRESEERLRSTVEAAQLGTWDYNPRTKTLFWNARCKELFGLPPDTEGGHPLALAAVHAEDRPRIEQAGLRALTPGGDGVFDIEFRTLAPREGGLERWLRASGRAIFAEGAPVRFIGTVLDITEIVKARETLAERRAELERLVAERTARLQETIAELEGFSYSISHDLRAPLRAMQSFAQLLNDECADRVGEDGRDYLRRIINASARMDRLIHDVLVYSQVARTELQLRPVNLQTLVDGIVESYPQFQRSAADIVIARDLPSVIGNEAALTQCVSNLLGNAVKFVPPGVRPHIEITAERVGARVHLCVKDNGIGIPPEMHEKIFGIFERLSRSYEGTGIGLAVVRKAAERMGGRVSVQSAPGAGSTFCLELPAAP
jgi:PAS domain S-box-containing protein